MHIYRVTTIADIDGKFCSQINALYPTAGRTRFGGDVPRSFGTADDSSASEILRSWHAERSGNMAETSATDIDWVAIENIALEQRADYLDAIQQAGLLQNDPDRVTDHLHILLSHALGGLNQENTAALLQDFAARLSTESNVTSVDPLLLERAVLATHALPDILSFIQKETELDVESVASALAEYQSWLTTLTGSAARPSLRKSDATTLLRARGFSYTIDEAIDETQRVIEDMRMEKRRIALRAFKEPNPELVVDHIREQSPVNATEAMSWLSELIDKSGLFARGQELVGDDELHIGMHEGNGGMRRLFGRSALFPSAAGSNGGAHLVLSLPTPIDCRELHVCALESLTARLIEPGQARANNTSVSAPIRANDFAGPSHALAMEFGAEALRAVGLYAETLVRESGFRDSLGARYVALDAVEKIALRAYAELQLLVGSLGIDEVTALLQQELDLDDAQARWDALDSYRTPLRSAATLFGYEAMQNARARARSAWKHTFSEARFLSRINSAGALPSNLLSRLFG